MFQIFFKSNNSFEGILQEEKTILVLRKHPLFFYLPIFFFFFLILLVFAIIQFFSSSDFFIKFSSLIWFLYAVFCSILWLALFINLMIYSLSVLILTNKRLIQIETKGLFNYERNDLELFRIQDVSIEIRGILASFLNFGDILVQTAGTEVKFYFSSLPNPLKIKEDIFKIKNKFINYSGLNER
jgi:membrane protein YdbS with pleckstrin-like domain